MRALVIDDAAKQAVMDVVVHASKPENFYVVGPGGSTNRKPPGDDPRFCVKLNTFRCVFSFTRADGKVWRHLSISIPSEKYPHPFAVWTIAEMFGFTGWNGISQKPPDSWLCRLSEEEHCIVVAQEKQAQDG